VTYMITPEEKHGDERAHGKGHRVELCVAVLCSVAVCCSVLHCVAVCGSMFQSVLEKVTDRVEMKTAATTEKTGVCSCKWHLIMKHMTYSRGWHDFNSCDLELAPHHRFHRNPLDWRVENKSAIGKKSVYNYSCQCAWVSSLKSHAACGDER